MTGVKQTQGDRDGSGQPLFAPRVMIGVIVVGSVLLLASLYFLAEPNPDRRLDLHGARPTSTSAIGYRGLVLLLRDLGVTVEVSGRLPGEAALDDRLLFVTDQEALFADPDLLKKLLARDKVLMVLPKWEGLTGGWNRRWLDRVQLLGEGETEAVLSRIDGRATLVRPRAVHGWSLGPLPAKPALPSPQLIRSSRIKPVVFGDQGTLLGRQSRGGAELWLLSDPDLLSNHGLKRQPSLDLPLALLRHILGSDLAASPGILFLDLTLQSRPPPTNWFTALFRFPTVIVTLQLTIVCLLAGWAATGRFGRPEPTARALQPGKQVLVENAAALLRVGAHHRSVVRRYFEITGERLAQRLNAPRGLNRSARFEWLCALAKSRGLPASGEGLKERIDREAAKPLSEPRAVDLARHCDRWKRELLHEFGDDPRDP